MGERRTFSSENVVGVSDMSDFWHQAWWSFLWVVFPLLWFFLNSGKLWAKHSHRRKALDVLKVYAQKGTEPPQELTKIIAAEMVRDTEMSGYWRSAIFFGCMSLAFCLMAVFGVPGNSHGSHGVTIVAIIMAVLAVCNVAAALRPKS
jgi:hypothetical protein